MEPFEEHERRLREAYVKASPEQRLDVAMERMKLPDCGPNRLIQIVSAVEGLARSLVVNTRVARGEAAEVAYDSVRYAKAPALVGEAFSLLGRPTPIDVLGAETWETFEHAVQFRNLLIHECTFLRQDLCSTLFEATSIVFGRLAGLIAVLRGSGEAPSG